jgi:protein-S-isoprenylcysteine O-methyltransferase Ste14
MNLILLPVAVTIFIPFVLVSLSLFLFGLRTHLSNNFLVLISSLISIYIGLFLMGTTILLFLRIGQGTPVPWDPPKYLVIRGPYRYVRNPMINGVLLILLGKTLMFWSVVLLAWTAVFLAADLVYFPLVEGKSCGDSSELHTMSTQHTCRGGSHNVHPGTNPNLPRERSQSMIVSCDFFPGFNPLR